MDKMLASAVWTSLKTVWTSLKTDNEVLVVHLATDMVRKARLVIGSEGLADTGTIQASCSRQVTDAKRDVETEGHPGRR